MEAYREVLDTPVAEGYDVIVAGGGSAGFGAAVNAARGGARTLLIEREYMIGGIMTAGLMAKIAIEPFMTGIPTEFLMRLGKEKMAIPYESFPAPWPPSEMVEVPVDAETCKLVAVLIESAKQQPFEIGIPFHDGFDVVGKHMRHPAGRQSRSDQRAYQ